MMDLRLLGTTCLDGALDADALLGRPRDLAVLAYLAAARPSGFHTRDALLALLWPESDERHARNALNQALHRLRRSLGDALVSRGTHQVGLDIARVASDVDRFRAAIAANRPEAALEEYQGDLLCGFHLSDAPAFEQWLEQERSWLRRSAQDAARARRDEAASVGEREAALRCARRAAELSRDEGDVLRLAEVQAQAGDRLAALRTCEEFRRWLRDELELEPSAAFRAATQVLRADRGASPRGAILRVRAATGAPAPAPGAVERWRRVLVVGVPLALLAIGAVWAAVRFPRVTAAEPLLTSSADAADFYARGREYWRLGIDADRGTNWELAVEMFDSAVARDPEFAAAHGELAMAHLRLFHWGFDRSAARQELAERAIGRALALDPDLPEARIALGYYHLWSERDYERAVEAGTRALEARPEHPDALALIVAATRRLGKIADAVDPLRELVTIQARTYFWRWELASTFVGLRRYKDARDELDRAVALFPAEPGFYFLGWQVALLESGDVRAAARELARAATRLPPDHLWPLEFGLDWLSRDYPAALRVLERVRPTTFRTQNGEFPAELMYGLVHRLAGDSAEARRFYRAAQPALQQKIALRPDEMWYHLWLAIGLAGGGDPEGALHEARRSEELAAAAPDLWENPFFEQGLLHVYIMNGDRETAVTMVESLLRSHHYLAISVPWLRIDPRFDPLRTHPRFQRIVGENQSRPGRGGKARPLR